MIFSLTFTDGFCFRPVLTITSPVLHVHGAGHVANFTVILDRVCSKKSAEQLSQSQEAAFTAQ